MKSFFADCVCILIAVLLLAVSAVFLTARMVRFITWAINEMACAGVDLIEQLGDVLTDLGDRIQEWGRQ